MVVKLAGDMVQAHTRASGEMADALASGASVRKDVGVRVPPRALESQRLAPRMLRLTICGDKVIY